MTSVAARLGGGVRTTLLLAVPAVLLPLGAALAPVPTTFAILVAAGGIMALRMLGVRTTLWSVFVATIALREPLSIDVVGTKTVYFNDVLILPLLAVTLHENGIGRIWRRSPAFRLGAAVLVLGIVASYRSTVWVSALDQLHRIFTQLATFTVAWHFVRTPRQARLTAVAFLVGMIPAALFGIHQSSLSVTAFREQTGWTPAVAWGPGGTPRVRTIATFSHALKYAHALTMGLAICLGLLFRVRSAVRRLLLVGAAALFVSANQFTYSLGGLIGSATAVGTAALVRNRKWIVLLPVVGAAWLALAPATFLNRITSILEGEHTSFMARMVTYQQAANLLADHPVMGVGWGSHAMTEEYQLVRTKGIQALAAAENFFLQRAIATGFLGMGLAIALCVLYFVYAFTKPPDGFPITADRWPREMLIIAGAAFYVQAQTQPTADNPNNYLLWILLAIAERMRMAYRGES